MAIVLFDDQQRNGLYPLTLTKAIASLRIGILTIRERWQLKSGEEVWVHTTSWLQALYEPVPAGEHLWISANVLADDALADKIVSLEKGMALADEYGLVAARVATEASFDITTILPLAQQVIDVGEVRRLQYPWQLFQWNDALTREDFDLVTRGRVSAVLPGNNQLLNAGDIFVEEGADVSFATLNATTGPIYIGRNATIMEGSLVRGPFVLGEGAVLKMGAKIYGATTLGPYCTGGGEIKNVIMQGYSNKAHDGYLGDSVIGEWCNMGAGTSNSNLKNTAGDIQVWYQAENRFLQVGRKCGVIMGDYSRTAINTAINTGTVIGICCNVFGEGLSPKVINSFTWGNDPAGYELNKAFKDIDNWKKLKHRSLSGEEALVLKHIFGQNG